MPASKVQSSREADPDCTKTVGLAHRPRRAPPPSSSIVTPKSEEGRLLSQFHEGSGDFAPVSTESGKTCHRAHSSKSELDLWLDRWLDRWLDMVVMPNQPRELPRDYYDPIHLEQAPPRSQLDKKDKESRLVTPHPPSHTTPGDENTAETLKRSPVLPALSSEPTVPHALLPDPDCSRGRSPSPTTANGPHPFSDRPRAPTVPRGVEKKWPCDHPSDGFPWAFSETDVLEWKDVEEEPYHGTDVLEWKDIEDGGW
ncbi:hypothetical protein F4808DRAFT_465509 [Astrocystis sublimbata]|nr:hypothetical protein F4808DRAFT_465509 [Astrocystis sublimbata]